MTEKNAVTPQRRVDLDGQTEDADLLRRYLANGSEAAFAQLVRRRIDFVYSVALRRTGGNRHRAEEATQAVFTDLARKARTLAERPVLVGWLFRSARYAAAGLVRSEQRRQARELEAHTMQTTLTEPTRDEEWQQVRPMLDDVLGEIADRDRDAILLRFFDGRSFAEIGVRLQLTENAARMRVERALDQLAVALRKRGVTSTASALAAAIGYQVTAATPAGLATAVTSAALAQASVGGGTSLLAVLGVSNVQAGFAAALIVAGATGYVWQREAGAALRSELAALGQQERALAALRAENRRLSTAAAEVEMLRRDDSEFRQLTRQIEDVRRAIREKARLPQRAETERSGIVAAVPVLNNPHLAYERAFQQDMARYRAEQAKTVARFDQERAAASPEAQYHGLIQEVRVFASNGEFNTAVRRYNLAMQIKPADVPVTEEVKELRASLALQNVPVDVTFKSDGQTFVTVRFWKPLRPFESTTEKLLPGDYVVVGQRTGYREVRMPLVVRNGEAPPVITVACTERIDEGR